jgi:hypothetical protein
LLLSQSLVGTILSFSLIGSFFFIVAVMVVVDPTSIGAQGLRTQVIILGPLYAFALVGVPCSALLIARAVDADPAEEAVVERRTKSGPTKALSGTVGSTAKERAMEYRLSALSSEGTMKEDEDEGFVREAV